jgi:hypothetical protein
MYTENEKLIRQAFTQFGFAHKKLAELEKEKSGENMNNTEVCQQINQYLDGLSSEHLQLIADFLAYLADK